MSNTKLRIYVACLAAYNNGYLHGEWIDANQDVDSLFSDIKMMLAKSPIHGAEEWAIHDYEGFDGIHIDEYTSLDKISELSKFIEEHGDVGIAIYGYCNDIDDAVRYIEESYHGEFDSEEDFVRYWIHEVDCIEIPKHLENYIDYETMARDYFINDFLSIEAASKVHVFSYI